MYENAIIAYGASPLIKQASIPYIYFKPALQRPWNTGMKFTVLLDTTGSNKAVKIFIRKCGINMPAVKTIHQDCDSFSCDVFWNGRGSNGIFVAEGCYKAEIYGSDDRANNLESLSPYPFSLQFYVFY